MTTPMGPPQLGYSLRVQLYSATALTTSDRPLRLFRVFTRPEATVREFCEEASKIHRENYGRPIAIKRCQDEQEFDISGSDVVGNVFANAAMIRVIEAASHSSARDSVPPTSALRYNPPSDIRKSTIGKRAREGSIARRTSSPPVLSRSNKRQKVVGLDPDHPIPSLENPAPVRGPPYHNGQRYDMTVIPDSQGDMNTDSGTRSFSKHRNVRDDHFEVFETPAPSPPPEAHSKSSNQNPSTDHLCRKSTIREMNDTSKVQSANKATPKQGEPIRAQSVSSNPQRAKSASYHIARATERGTSVSTAATSPLSEQVAAATRTPNAANRSKGKSLGSAQNATVRSANSSVASSTKRGGKQSPRYVDEDSIYDNVPSDNDEAAAAILNTKKAGLRLRNSPRSGLPGLKFANHQVNTPPSIPRRVSRPQDEGSVGSPGELPLTPRSKALSDEQRDEAANVRRAQTSAAQAAERRRQEDREKKAEEAIRAAEKQRSEREEQEKLDVEELQRAQAEQAAKIETANRLEKEREERRAEQEAKQKKRKEEEQSLKLEQAKKAERRREQERLAAQKRLEEEKSAKQKAEKERVERERIQAEEAKRARVLDEERTQREKSASAKRARAEKSSSRDVASPLDVASILPQSRSRSGRSDSGTPGSSRGPSSTPFIPTGRKSTLKNRSSHASSSPSVQSNPPEVTATAVGIDTQMPLPKQQSRRISFAEGTNFETPIKPPNKSFPQKPASSSAPQKHSLLTRIVPPEKQSKSPIVPPSRANSSKERSLTPMILPKPNHPPKKTSPTAKAKTSPSAMPPPNNKEVTPNQVTLKAKSVSKEPTIEKSKVIEIPSDSEEESGDDDEDDEEHSEENEDKEKENRVSKANPISRTSLHPEEKNSVSFESAKTPIEEEDTSDDDSEEDIPAAVDTETMAARAERSKQSPSLKKAASQPEPEPNDEQDEESDRESNPSSMRESRSPVVFNQHPHPKDAPKPKRVPSREPASSSEDEEDTDEEMADVQTTDLVARSDKEHDELDSEDQVPATATDMDVADVGNETSSQTSSDEEGEEPEQVVSSSPQLPRHKSNAILDEIRSRDYSDKESGDTQAEIAEQLASSMYEARPSAYSSSIRYPPSSSAAQPLQRPPTVKFGASLTKLSQLSKLKKDSRTSSPTSNGLTGPRTKQISLREASEEELSEEESDDSSSSSEDEASQPELKSTSPPSNPNGMKSRTANPPSDSDSDSDLSNEGVDKVLHVRNEVMAKIAVVAKDSQTSAASSISSPTTSRKQNTQPSQSRRPKLGYGKAAPKRKDPYLTGYKFSQPR